MEPEAVLDITKEAIIVLLKMSLPLLIVALIIGSLVSLVQALTQIQEPTLTFVPKLVGIFFTAFVMMSYMGHVMSAFMSRISSLIIHLE